MDDSDAPTGSSSLPQFKFASLAGLSHGISTRHGGASPAPYATLNMGYATDDDEVNVAQNRRTFLEALGIEPEQVVSGRLVHGAEVAVFGRDADDSRPRRPVRPSSTRSEPVFFGDAVVSDVPGLYFVLTFADCVPLLYRDRRRGVVGVAHAGWRGTALGIAGAVLTAMQTHFGTVPADIQVGIGPSIGPCCYRVGAEVLSTFRRQGIEPTVAGDGRQLDLWNTNRRQLEEVGVSSSAIENPCICTACNVSTYYSHRGEGGRTGRFAICAGLD